MQRTTADLRKRGQDSVEELLFHFFISQKAAVIEHDVVSGSAFRNGFA